ncbi:hypothetical protein SAMN05443550_102457 [Pedobacter hartonius]|uniref:Uncharacterized protein n=1 Tax=Pedobacter hartonius TaxID=425514 RepID=A0A1H3ZQQ0_9SPHI|nr:hypothetical protein SAMN05443550_102457 [Pedobacter hartonius]
MINSISQKLIFDTIGYILNVYKTFNKNYQNLLRNFVN